MFYKIYKDNPTPALLTLDTTSSGTLSLFLQSLNGTNYMLPFQIKKFSVFSKIVSLQFIRTSSPTGCVFDCDKYYKGIRLITRLRAGLR